MSEVLLPPNASAQELALEQATARLGEVPTVGVRRVWDVNSCPAELLPWLAWAYSLDDWNPEWDNSARRHAISKSVAIHRYKGTIGAVRDALFALGFEVRVQEWFNQAPEGEPYTFRLLLDVSQVPLDQDALIRIQDVVNSNKNLRSHLDVVVPSITTTAGPVMAGVLKAGANTGVGYGFGAFPHILMEGAVNGYPQTEAAVDSLHTLLHETMPAANYW